MVCRIYFICVTNQAYTPLTQFVKAFRFTRSRDLFLPIPLNNVFAQYES